MQKLPDHIKKRSCTCIRWCDEDMHLVTETAYSKRISCSALIRGIVLDKLQSKEVSPEQKQNAQP